MLRSIVSIANSAVDVMMLSVYGLVLANGASRVTVSLI